MSDKPFWLVSVPKNNINPLELQRLKLEREKDLATNFAYNTPDFRVGTLDQLMTLSDDLTKVDNFVEAVVKKIAKQFKDMLDEKEAKDDRIFIINGANIETYLRNFPWDEAKYSTKKTLRELVDIIAAKISKLDEELKNHMTDYTILNQAIASSKRQESGNMTVRNLAELVRAEHIIQSEYLTTLVVAVSKNFYRDWQIGYEKLTDWVLPRSSQVIAEDLEYMLVTVTLFRKVVDEFKTKAREKRFNVREFEFSADGASTEAATKKKQEEERAVLHKKLTIWCKTNFTEAFTSWIHLKAIRVFVESILRFGLPANFQVVLTVPHKKANEKRVHDTLTETYKNLVSAHFNLNDPNDENSEKFYPYVFLNINMDWS
eukprot:TRINITY_DN3604_c0_g1_i1.p1 TRINITY_DN3604_c0_g1~~TRINITY_DN3604_c0_g1_i1.p1  ORF type:complete len:374 (-),score=154.30 TRINITY_DN3604_c0_g1_i1:177-1298(-)